MKFIQFASVGEAKPDKKYKGDQNTAGIVDSNVIRENARFTCGTVQDTGITVVGKSQTYLWLVRTLSRLYCW